MPLGIGSSSHDHLLLIHLLRHRAFRMFETTMYYATDQWDCIELYREKKHKRRKLIIQARLGLAPFLLLPPTQWWCQSSTNTHTHHQKPSRVLMVKLFSSSLVVLLPNGQNFQSCFFGTEGKVRRRRRLGRTGLLGFISFASFFFGRKLPSGFDLWPVFSVPKIGNQLYWKLQTDSFHIRTLQLCFEDSWTKISKANVLKGALMRNLAI